ncbi:kelch repeat and BTB domain-containing protein 8-like [Spea bombifrons]|uniref:kelch repeat and BTB domain-containing protein 8-like n=1 Tax=Spea bombifrons TaxID=233779 RepID=UPI00234BEBA5|nr:kelch repeat and BTB domain-containing protein 8-like [Spea bombifrons]
MLRGNYKRKARTMHECSDQAPFYTKSHEKLAGSIMKGLKDLYLAEILCDTTIVTNGKRFMCHRVVLASISPYFQAMFTSSLKESKFGEVQLLDIPPSAIETILYFIYTGLSSLSLDTAQELFVVSSRLQITPMQDLCSNYLINSLNKENCLWIYKMAHCHNHKSLLEAALKFISCHVTQLSEEEDFLHLDLDELTSILSSDQLMVSSELSVYNFANRWWEFNNYRYNSFPVELLKAIRLPLMTQHELNEVSKYIDQEIPFQHSKCIQLRHGMFEQKIVCMDLQAREDVFLDDGDFQLDSYDPVSGVWEKLPSLKSLMCPGCLAIGNYLYVAGGIHRDDSVSNTLHLFDSVRNEWMELPPMTRSRSMHGFLACDQRLYAVGGWDGNDIIDTAEYFHITDNCWTVVSNLPLPLRCCASAQIKGKLYLIGGESSRVKSFSMHQGFLIYDTVSDTWSRFPLKITCSSAGAITFDDKVFVVGGYTTSKRSSSCSKATSRCFCIDPLGRVCHDCPMPPLQESLASAGVVLWKERVYVLGGEDGNNFSNRIYYWTPGDFKWTLSNEKLPILYDGVSAFGCVTLQVPMKQFHYVIPERNAGHVKKERSHVVSDKHI